MKQKNIRYAQKYFGNSIKNLVGIVIYFFCQWLTTIIVIRIAGYTMSGEFSLVISFTNLFGFLSQYSIRNFQLSDADNEFLPRQYSGAYIITSGLAIALFLLALPFSGYDHNVIFSCFIYMLYKLCETFSFYALTYMQLENKYSDIAISYSLKGIIPLIGFTLCLYYTQNLFQALCIMSLLYIAIIIFFDIKKTRFFFIQGVEVKGTGIILKKCFPLMLASLIFPFMLFLTRHSVEKVYGSTELGYYSAFTMVIVVFSTMAAAVYQVILPTISEKYLKHLKKDIFQIIFMILGIISFVSLIVLLLAIFIGNFALSFIFGPEILEHMYLLLPVVIASIALTIMTFSSVCLTAMQKRVPMLIGMLTGAALLSTLVMPITRSKGMLGTANIFTISLCVIIIIHGFLIIKYLFETT